MNGKQIKELEALYDTDFKRGDGSLQALADKFGLKAATLRAFAHKKGWGNPERGAVVRPRHRAPAMDAELRAGLEIQRLMRLWAGNSSHHQHGRPSK